MKLLIPISLFRTKNKTKKKQNNNNNNNNNNKQKQKDNTNNKKTLVNDLYVPQSEIIHF